MNQLVKQNYIGQDLAIAERTGGMSIAPRNVADVIEFGHLMSTSGHAVPKHLRGNPGACMAVAMQAFEWEMSPFAVARKTYLVNDNIAYEAQLIAAVINTRAGLKQRLAIEWHAEGSELFCTVKGEFRDGSKHTYTSPPVGSITTKNSPLWKSDPRQQIAYFSVRSWGRLYAPEVILGIYDRDEAEQIGPDRAKDITPVIDPFSDAPPVDQEGRQDALSVDSQDATADAATLTGEPAGGQSEEISQSSDPSPDEGSDGATSPGETVAATNSEPAAADPEEDATKASETASKADHGGQSASSSEPIPADWLKSFAKMIVAAIAVDEQFVIGTSKGAFIEGLSQDQRDRARAITNYARAVCRNEMERSDALEVIAGKADVDIAELQ